jgi:hypothetical protein
VQDGVRRIVGRERVELPRAASMPSALPVSTAAWSACFAAFTAAGSTAARAGEGMTRASATIANADRTRRGMRFMTELPE